MTERYESQQKYFMLILSLLIHLGILIALLKLTRTDQYILEKLPFYEHTTQEQKKLPLPNNQIAALKSRASTFGAPIIFHEEPEIQAHSGDLQGNDSIDAPGDTSEPEIQMQQTTAQENTFDQEPEKVEEQLPNKQTQKTQEATSILIGTAKKDDTKAERKPKKELSKPEEKIEKKPVLQSKPIPSKKQIRKKVGKKRPGDSTRTATPAKKQLTLADLAEGFINTLNRGGNDWLDRDGDPNIKPDFNDLKYMSYIRKVVWYMQNEWHATQNKLQITLQQDCILSIVITFAKDGNVQNIRVLQESGNSELDEFLLKGIRRAAPYPPLPHHFNSDTFDLPLNIHNSSQSAMPWQMNLSSRSLRSR